MLRYRTGDLVTAETRHGACVCGHHELALVGGILGRTDDMIVVRGVNIYPRAVEELVQLVGGVAEYQVSVAAGQALGGIVSLRIEPDANCADPAALADRLEKKFQSSFGLRVPVEAVEAGTLPRFEMKARRWVKV